MAVHVALTEEDGIWVAQCIEFDVASQGRTREHAVQRLKECAAIYMEELGHLPEWQTVEVELSARPT